MLSSEVKKSQTLARVRSVPGSPGTWPMNLFDLSDEDEGHGWARGSWLGVFKRSFERAFDKGKGDRGENKPSMGDYGTVAFGSYSARPIEKRKEQVC